MAVHLTRIYTRTGDDGTTALGDFSRVRKTDPRLVAYADFDEANAAIGVAVALGGARPRTCARSLRQVQNDLFDVGADLCTPIVAEPAVPAAAGHRRTTSTGWRAGATRSTRTCPADSFILPGGTPGAALLHVARTVAAARRTLGVGAAGGRSGAHQPADRPLPQPAVGPAVHPGRVANPDGDVLWLPGGAR